MPIRTRAFLAVALLVGFYALALGVIAALLYLPYAEWRYVERVVTARRVQARGAFVEHGERHPS